MRLARRNFNEGWVVLKVVKNSSPILITPGSIYDTISS